MKNLITILFLLPTLVYGQTILQVVTKKIEKTFPYKDGYEVNVEGEKAEIVVETWDKPEIQIVMELTAKHPDKAIAERDLETIKYLAERVKKNIYIRNYISPEEDQEKPESNLSARYTITLPEECGVYLKDYFGHVNVSNLVNKLRVYSEFSSIDILNVQGQIDVNTRFGDLVGTNIDGIMRVNSRRSNITLSEIKGQFDINSYFGVLKIFADNNLIDLNITGEKSDVFFYNANPLAYGYNLSAQNGSIQTLDEIDFKSLEKDVNLHKVAFKPGKEFYPSITISVSFGKIVVERPPVKP